MARKQKRRVRRVKRPPPLPLLDEKQRYAIPEAAALLRISRAQVYRLINAKSLTPLHDGARIFIPGSEIIARSTLGGSAAP